MEEDAKVIARKKLAKAKKAKKRRIIGWIVLSVVVIALGVGGWLFYQYLQKQQLEETLTSYDAVAVRSGEVSSVISGSGTLSANHAASFTAPGDYTTVESVRYQTGDAIRAGDVVMTLSCLEVEEEIDTLEASLDDVLDKLATVDQNRSTSGLNVTAPKRGVVKDIAADVGTVAEDADYLCLLSTDGKMKVVIDKTDTMKKFDAVIVRLSDGTQIEGLITEFDTDGEKATVIVEDDDSDLAYGEAVTVLSDNGATLSTGTLDVNEYVKVSAASGRVAAVKCVRNKAYAKGRALFRLDSGALTDDYLTYKAQRESLEEQIQNLKDGLIITAEWDCILTSLSVEKGDELSEGGELCSLAGTDGYEMSLAIDELDIASVLHGQAATVTLDAIDGTFAGTVENISYAGSGSYVTSYTVTIVTEPIEGAYPGMSASAEIVIESSGDALLVPVGALQYDGRGEEQTSYLYLAAEGTEAGTTKTAEEIDLASLTKITVETGMSDGSYIVVTGKGLHDGDVIWQSTLTTTATYTEDDSTTASFNMGGMGGMPGGGMPGGDMGGGYTGGGMPSGNMPGGNSR